MDDSCGYDELAHWSEKLKFRSCHLKSKNSSSSKRKKKKKSSSPAAASLRLWNEKLRKFYFIFGYV